MVETNQHRMIVAQQNKNKNKDRGDYSGKAFSAGIVAMKAKSRRDESRESETSGKVVRTEE